MPTPASVGSQSEELLYAWQCLLPNHHLQYLDRCLTLLLDITGALEAADEQAYEEHRHMAFCIKVHHMHS